MAELEGVLPEMALRFLPVSLSRESQQKLCELEAEEAGKILNHVIDLINGGSIETVDSLTQNALEKSCPVEQREAAEQGSCGTGDACPKRTFFVDESGKSAYNNSKE